jgi:hypothetical protein
MDYNKFLRTSASASRLTENVEILKISWAVLWIIIFIKITLGKIEKLRRIRVSFCQK